MFTELVLMIVLVLGFTLDGVFLVQVAEEHILLFF